MNRIGEEARGLWTDERATGAPMLAGQPATPCDYRHCDGPLCSRMTSVVNQRIPASFSLHPARPDD